MINKINNLRLSQSRAEAEAIVTTAGEKHKAQAALVTSNSTQERLKSGNAYLKAVERGHSQQSAKFISDLEESKRLSAHIATKVRENNSDSTKIFAAIIAQPAPMLFLTTIGRFIDRYA